MSTLHRYRDKKIFQFYTHLPTYLPILRYLRAFRAFRPFFKALRAVEKPPNSKLIIRVCLGYAVRRYTTKATKGKKNHVKTKLYRK